MLTATGYSLPEARSAELAQEQLERARQLVFEQHGFKMPRLCCPRLVRERESAMSPALRAKLEANALKQENDATNANSIVGGRLSAEEASALGEVSTYCPAVVRGDTSVHPGATQEERTVDARIRRLDLARGAERMSYLPYVEEEADHWEKIAGDLAADAALDRGPVHAAELRRRERKRLYAYLSSQVRGDHTLLDIYAPLWERRPQGLRPHASNPAAMWRTFPEYAEACKEIDDDLPTSRVPTSERHQNFRIGHMWHCRRCWQYSEAKWGTPPPVDELKRALLPGWTDPGQWSLDPGCYQRLQIHFIRTGYEPRVDPKAAPARGRQRNPPNVYEEYDKMVDYLESLESLPFNVLSKGEFQPPPVASGLLAVVRDSDRRAWERDGVEYPVRPCWNGKSSGINDMLYDWHFRMAGVDSATRLLKDLRTSRPHAQLGARGVDERFTTGVHGEWGPIGTTGSPSIAGCIKTVENSRQRRSSTDLSVGHPTKQHTLPELLLADGRHELPRLCENSLGDGVPTPACNTGSGRRASLYRGARAELPQGSSSHAAAAA